MRKSTIKILNTFRTTYEEGKSLVEIISGWKKTMFKVLKNEFGFNKKARKEVFEWGEYGFNWKELHSEDDKDATYYKEKFFSDVHYCSDRLDFNRLLRLHHQFRLMEEKMRREQEKEEGKDQ